MKVYKMKKLFAVLLCACLIISTVSTPAQAATKCTDAKNHKYEKALLYAANHNLLKVSKSKIQPDKKLTRGDAVRGLNQLLGATKQSDVIKKVTDVKKGSTYYQDMSIALNAGLLTLGKDSKLSPSKGATYQYVAALFAKVLNTTTDSVLGKLDGKHVLTRAEYANFILKQAPNIVSKSTSKVSKGNVYINTPGITLSNLTINGNLIVGDGVADKEVTLSNVKVTGTTIIRGGGEHSIIIIGTSELSTIVIKQVNNKVSLKVSNDSSVKLVYINDGSNDVNIVGPVGTLNIEGDNLNITTDNATIQNVIMNGNNSSFNVSETSKVESVTIEKSAAASKIEVDGTVSKITANAENASITGSGTVKDAVINGNNGTITTPGTKVTVADGVTGTNAPAANNPTDSNTPGAGGGSGSGSGSGSGGGSGSGDNSGNNPGTIPNGLSSTDARFAVGYPKIELDAATHDITVTIKLKDNVATAENPAELYSLISTVNSNCYADSLSVIHGHLGMVKDGIDSSTYVEHCDYASIADSNEHVFQYKAGSNVTDGLVCYFVIKTPTETSSVPTKYYFDDGVVGSFLDTQKPSIIKDYRTTPTTDSVYINKDQNKVYIYVDEPLEKASIPDVSAFTTNVTAVSASAITIPTVDPNTHYSNRIELTLDNPSKVDLSNLEITYTVPATNPIKDLANIPNTMDNFTVKPVSAVPIIKSAYISEDGKVATISMSPNLFNEGKDVVVKINDVAYNTNYSFNRNEITFHVTNDSAISNSTYNVTVQAVDGAIVYDSAQNPFTSTPVKEATKLSATSVTVGSAEYDSANKKMKITLNGELVDSTISGCQFTVTVGGKTYTVRGFGSSNYFAGTTTITLFEESLRHINFAGATNFTVSFTGNDDSYLTLKNRAGVIANPFTTDGTVK